MVYVTDNCSSAGLWKIQSSSEARANEHNDGLGGRHVLDWLREAWLRGIGLLLRLPKLGTFIMMMMMMIIIIIIIIIVMILRGCTGTLLVARASSRSATATRRGELPGIDLGTPRNPYYRKTIRYWSMDKGKYAGRSLKVDKWPGRGDSCTGKPAEYISVAPRSPTPEFSLQRTATRQQGPQRPHKHRMEHPLSLALYPDWSDRAFGVFHKIGAIYNLLPLQAHYKVCGP